MKGLLFFILGTTFGSIFCITVMCILQINRLDKIENRSKKNNLL